MTGPLFPGTSLRNLLPLVATPWEYFAGWIFFYYSILIVIG